MNNNSSQLNIFKEQINNEADPLCRVFISEELFTIKSHSPFGLSSMKQLINDRNNRCDRGNNGGFVAELDKFPGLRERKSEQTRTSFCSKSAIFACSIQQPSATRTRHIVNNTHLYHQTLTAANLPEI